MSQSKPVEIDRYNFPEGKWGRTIIIMGVLMALSSRREVISPGSPLYDYALAGRPRAITWATNIQKGLFYFLFGAHSIETVLFAFTRLRKHVKFLNLAWFQWMLACFVGGVYTFEHFDSVVAGKQA